MLTDTKARNAKPDTKPYRLADSGGLHLYVPPTGDKVWRWRYRFLGKEKTLTFGAYPQITLAKARELRDEARKVLQQVLDPAVVRKQRLTDRQENTFEAIAREWHELNKPRWTAKHADDVLASLERDVFGDLGAMPIEDITPPMVLSTLRKIEARPAIETARRVRQRMSAVFVYGIATARCQSDPAAIVQNALAPLVKGRQPAITDLEEARGIMVKVDATPSYPPSAIASP